MRVITVALYPEVERMVNELVETGLFGTSREDVVQRLFEERLREVVLKGWVRVSGRAPKPAKSESRRRRPRP